jgi:hypothetical protein
MKTVASMADYMSAEEIVQHFREKGISIEIVTGGLYPIGIACDGTTLYVPALQPLEHGP